MSDARYVKIPFLLSLTILTNGIFFVVARVEVTQAPETL